MVPFYLITSLLPLNSSILPRHVVYLANEHSTTIFIHRDGSLLDKILKKRITVDTCGPPPQKKKTNKQYIPGLTWSVSLLSPIRDCFGVTLYSGGGIQSTYQIQTLDLGEYQAHYKRCMVRVLDDYLLG